MAADCLSYLPVRMSITFGLFVCWTLLPSASPLRLKSFVGNDILSSLGNGKNNRMTIVMRKQKASDKRTSRLQKGLEFEHLSSFAAISPSKGITPFPVVTSSPMATATWNYKTIDPSNINKESPGRGRARKRAQFYTSLASYHTEFLNLLTEEYRAEEAEVINRLEASLENPLALEQAGHCFFDMYPERRGNIFSDEVYRLVKATDSVSSYMQNDALPFERGLLPKNHKFSTNDVIMLTLQPRGSGDFFGAHTLPNNKGAVSTEARVLNTGPTYVDVALPMGSFEVAFGPAPNNRGQSGKGDPNLRIRVDRFFSNVPYVRGVAAISKLTSLPKAVIQSDDSETKKETITLDSVIRKLILSTYTFADPSSARYQDPTFCNIADLNRLISKPPLSNSASLASQAIALIQSSSRFRKFNSSQMKAIGAALTRRVTLIQGPPGTGKTACAGAIAFGFAYQCRTINLNAKVLACAFSNVGADNLAAEMIRLGLRVVRIGKASAVTESLWDFTLDAAIDRDPNARQALQDAAIATSSLRGSAGKEDREVAMLRREMATRSVKASIEACNVAATKALREADVIVCTSIGAADPRLLAACGIVTEGDADYNKKDSEKDVQPGDRIPLAPDGLPSMTLPFTIVDEACQSVEPANLIPITSTDSCRSLVLLGDPCQLPPTVKSDVTGNGPLSTSLMARLAAILPPPITTSADKTDCDDEFLNAKPARQAVSLIEYRSRNRSPNKTNYKKQFPGSIMLHQQYRMHPSICAFASAVFYDSLLSTPSYLAEMRPFPDALKSIFPVDGVSAGSIRFVNVGGQRNEHKGEASAVEIPAAISIEASTSFSNKAEAEHIIFILKSLIRGCKNAASVPESIGIISPYTAQVSLIKTMFDDPELADLLKYAPTTIEVKTVDAYQGRERDIIIFSAVRSNRVGQIGFLSDWRRMNVAMTRAKSGLIVVGDKETLKGGDLHWEAFIKWCESSYVMTELNL